MYAGAAQILCQRLIDCMNELRTSIDQLKKEILTLKKESDLTSHPCNQCYGTGWAHIYGTIVQCPCGKIVEEHKL
jgi:hypothetical protein